MKKELYVSAAMDVLRFDTEDVIITSGEAEVTPTPMAPATPVTIPPP